MGSSITTLATTIVTKTMATTMKVMTTLVTMGNVRLEKGDLEQKRRPVVVLPMYSAPLPREVAQLSLKKRWLAVQECRLRPLKGFNPRSQAAVAEPSAAMVKRNV